MFVNGTKTIKIKANYSAISPYPLCLGNISKDWPVDSMKKTGLKSYVYDFSVTYDVTGVSDILDIHQYLMKKKKKRHSIKCLGLLKRCFS